MNKKIISMIVIALVVLGFFFAKISIDKQVEKQISILKEDGIDLQIEKSEGLLGSKKYFTIKISDKKLLNGFLQNQIKDWQNHNLLKEPIYDFSEFGEIQDINFRDLRDIVRNNKNMVTNGRFYILNEKAVKELRLESAYNKMLSNEEIATIFNKDAKSVVELYKLAPTGEKETIIDLVIDRKLNGQPIDANVLIQLGELCGKDLINMEA